MTDRPLACAIVRSRFSQRGDSCESVAGQWISYVDDGVLAVARITDPIGEGGGPPAPLKAYFQVLLALHGREAILPLRLGSFPHGDAAILDLLGTHTARWLRSLQEVEGCHEMGITLTLEEAGRSTQASVRREPDRTYQSGKDYLLCRRAEMHSGDARRVVQKRLAARWSEALSGYYRSCRVETATGAGCGPLSLSFLVPRDRLGEFRQAVRGLAALAPEETRLTGPWPPFSFPGY